MATQEKFADDINGPVQPIDGIAIRLFDLMAFGRSITRVLERRGLSYRAAAAKIGLPHYTLHRVATARHTPDVETYLRIMRWMECDRDY